MSNLLPDVAITEKVVRSGGEVRYAILEEDGHGSVIPRRPAPE